MQAGSTEPSFLIGRVPVYGRYFLSPMANFSDSPYRLLCRRYGAGFAFSEFISTDQLARGIQSAIDLLRFVPAERPIILQIFGNDPQKLLNAALYAQELEPDAIDINMGCSVRHVAHKGSGAGMLRDPCATGRIVEMLARNLEVPITAKIRLGWDHTHLNYLEVAYILEQSGIKMLSVHARTKAQAYKGRANWEAIAEIKARAKIPILGNGDVQSLAEARQKMSDSGVDGVLIGRAAIGNPWIFSGLAVAEISDTDILATMLRHFDDMLHFYPEKGWLLFRKHAARYLKLRPTWASHARQILTATDAESFRYLCLDRLPVMKQAYRRVG